MFAAGDRVVYPLHGGAVVKNVECRECNGEIREYLVLQTVFENMVVTIPLCNAEKIGLRQIVSAAELEQIAGILREIPDIKSIKSISWNRRFHLYMDKIKSGSIQEVARVFRILSCLENDKKISVGERRLLHNTRQILQSEIMLVKNIDAAQADLWLQQCC